MSLAEKLGTLRQKRGWSHSDLARATGIPQPTIWRLEKGHIEHPKADTLIALASAFKIPVDYLIQDEYQLTPTDLLRTDDDVRAMIKIYSSLSAQDRRAVRRIAQSLNPNTAEGKQRYVNLAVRAHQVRKE